MKTYNYLSNELPRELVEIYNDIQSDLLKIIVKNLKSKQRPEKVFQQIRDKVDSYNPKVQKVLSIIFADSKKKTVKDNEKEFKHEETDKKAVNNDQANALIAPLLISAMATIEDLNKKLVNNAVNKYSESYSYVSSPYGDGLSRLNQVYGKLAKNGITILESYGGGKTKNYSLENVIKRDVMYKVNQANAKVNMENFKKSSAKFIQVSSHPTARTGWRNAPYEDHASWQGKVYYSREGEPVEGYEEFESTCGYGELLGIGGINCYHEFQMNYTGDNTATQYDKDEVERNYALSQEQRAYERAIRQLKQARAVYEEAGLDKIANGISKNISMATSHLKDFCEHNNLKYYNWRTQI